MAHVTIDLPRLLSPVVGDHRHIAIEADDARGAVAALLARYPGLQVHLFDESGALRPNVLCAVDERPTRLAVGDERTLRDGSRIVFVQSVAGG